MSSLVWSEKQNGAKEQNGGRWPILNLASTWEGNPLLEAKSMSADVFVVTNIPIYAHDLDAGDNRNAAASLLQDLWERDGGIISTQVLQEFHVNVTAKIPRPISPAAACGVPGSHRTWQVQTISPDTILPTSEIQE